MRSATRVLVVLILLGGLVSCATGPAGKAQAVSSEHAAAPAVTTGLGASFYDTLRSLVGPKRLTVRPKPDGRDFNLVNPEKGAAGMLFGDSMDAVVDIWGKPSGITIAEYPRLWVLWIGACRFGFVAGRLTTVSVHSATVPDAYLENGITFQSSYEQVKQAFGQPVEESFAMLRFETTSGHGIRFQFMADTQGNRKLIAIEISRPEFKE